MCILEGKKCVICREAYGPIKIMECRFSVHCSPANLYYVTGTCAICTESRRIIKKYRNPGNDKDDGDKHGKPSIKAEETEAKESKDTVLSAQKSQNDQSGKESSEKQQTETETQLKKGTELQASQLSRGGLCLVVPYLTREKSVFEQQTQNTLSSDSHGQEAEK